MILEIIVVLLFFIVIYLYFKNREWKIKFDQKLKEWKELEEERIRKDAIERSARTLSGKTLEKMVPFLDEFPYDPHDVRWIGDPIDLVVFDGQSSGNLNQIVFCEVKSGEGALTKSQKKIKEIIEKKNIKWKEIKIEKS